VGELFVAKNAMSALVQEARKIDGGLPLARSMASLEEEFDRLSTRLQRAATGVRMVPLNETLRRLQRLVREVSVQFGKPVDLEVEGGTIEADKSVVDALFDPLLHILRNAIDHGIESVATREAHGKPSRGRVTVRVRQLGYRIEVCIADDGGGVDIERVRAAAVEKGIVSPEDAAGLDDAGVIELLFRSGFSTAAAVSDVSGRGVGMDAVRRDVQKAGGRVSIESKAGEGTTVTLSLPISFAVTRIMIVDAAGDRYALPMDAITETLRVDAGAINPVRAGAAMVLRDRTVPVVRLARLLGLTDTPRAEELLLIAEVGGAPVGLVVDRIGDRLETMLRPAAGILRTVNGISGTTVLGDGSVVMVLDLEALIE
jgi:two-component system chemotaxis sensor kinase CheA